MGDLQASDFIALTGTFFTAIAAGAAWRSAYLSNLTLSRERSADVSIDLVLLGGATPEVQIHLENSGIGLARKVLFYALEEDKYTANSVPPGGILRGKSGCTFATDLPASDHRTSKAVVQWIDGDDRVVLANPQGGRETLYLDKGWWQFGRTKATDQSIEEVFLGFYPEANLRDAQLVESRPLSR